MKLLDMDGDIGSGVSDGGVDMTDPGRGETGPVDTPEMPDEVS